MNARAAALPILILCAVFATASGQTRPRPPVEPFPPMPPVRPIPPVPPRPPRPFIAVDRSAEVNARLDGAILEVAVEQTYRNRGGGMQEVEVLLPIPADAVVTDGLLMADGREYPAEVLPAAEARAIYESIVRARRDPALLEYAGHGLIRLSAFPIPPGGERKVSYRYHQSVAAPEGRMRILFPVAALCGIDSPGPLDLRIAVDGRERLASVYSPSHDIEIERDDAYSARLRYGTDLPDPHETLELIVVRASGEIGCDWRMARGFDEDDYFLVAIAPGWDLLRGRDRQGEAITFILDTSGSMEGEKFEQARAALERFVEELSPRDRFNLIAFSNRVDPLFNDGARRADERSRRRAFEWIDDLEATGGTALAEAIDTGCRLSPRGGIVLLLTDGLPTVGETNRERILRRAADRGGSLRFYAFGVGYDVDAHLLDDLAKQGTGSVSYVRPGERIDEAVAELWRRVGYPCATDVRIEIAGARAREIYPEGPQVLFAGEPLLFAGRIRDFSRSARITITGTAPDGRRLDESYRIHRAEAGDESRSVPVLWASRKAADLIDRIRREGGDRRALAELQELSKRYGILNEEVALLAREDEPHLLADRGGQGVVPQGGSLRLRSMDAPLAAGMSQPEANDVDLSAKVWALREGMAGVGAATGGSKTERRTEGKSFSLRDGIWIDDSIPDPLPAGTKTIRIAPYGDAYFKLAAATPHLRAWLGAGERVRIYLDGILLEVDPSGEASLADRTIESVIEAAPRAR